MIVGWRLRVRNDDTRVPVAGRDFVCKPLRRMKRRLFRVLVAWYGLWQALHLGLNVAQWTGDRSAMVTGSASDDALAALGVSGYADLLVASPLGIAFAIGWFRGYRWAGNAGVVSLTVAYYSCYVWVYLHGVFGTWEPTVGRVLIMWGPFVLQLVLGPWLAVRLSRSGGRGLERSSTWDNAGSKPRTGALRRRFRDEDRPSGGVHAPGNKASSFEESPQSPIAIVGRDAAVIEGGDTGLQLSDVEWLALENVTVRGSNLHVINIDEWVTTPRRPST